MVCPDEAEGPVDALADADAGCGGNGKLGASAPLTDGERAAIKAKAVLEASNGEGLRQLTRSVSEALGWPVPLTPLLHQRKSGERLQGADQYATGCSIHIGYHVETFVHAVDQVNVCTTSGSEDDFGARSHTAGGVSSQIVGTEIGFGFDNHARGLFVENDGAQKRLGKFRRRNGESV